LRWPLATSLKKAKEPGSAVTRVSGPARAGRLFFWVVEWSGGQVVGFFRPPDHLTNDHLTNDDLTISPSDT
jgi:hypothetical protein